METISDIKVGSIYKIHNYPNYEYVVIIQIVLNRSIIKAIPLIPDINNNSTSVRLKSDYTSFDCDYHADIDNAMKIELSDLGEYITMLPLKLMKIISLTQLTSEDGSKYIDKNDLTEFKKELKELKAEFQL